MNYQEPQIGDMVEPDPNIASLTLYYVLVSDVRSPALWYNGAITKEWQ